MASKSSSPISTRLRVSIRVMMPLEAKVRKCSSPYPRVFPCTRPRCPGHVAPGHVFPGGPVQQRIVTAGQTLTYDVVVIGAGVAGLVAALGQRGGPRRAGCALVDDGHAERGRQLQQVQGGHQAGDARADHHDVVGKRLSGGDDALLHGTSWKDVAGRDVAGTAWTGARENARVGGRTLPDLS